MEPSQRNSVKRDVGEFVVEQILSYVQDGNSPVSGQRSFKSLNPIYAEREKAGDTTPNLDLEGDMLNALTFRDSGVNGLEIGIFDGDETPKAFGHNTGFRGHPTLENPKLKRQFIPEDDQDFKRDINLGIRDIISRYERGTEDLVGTFFGIQQDESGVEVASFLSADFIDSFLEDILGQS